MNEDSSSGSDLGAETSDNSKSINVRRERPLASLLLDGLAREYGTDKGGQYHGYAVEYGRILDDLRRGSRPKSVVEIGAGRERKGNSYICPSLAMWADWFSASFGGRHEIPVSVIGFDKLEFGINNGRILTLVCDQGNVGHLAAARHALKKAFGLRGGVDLIVDDGSHVAMHQQGTMKALWPVLRVGGAYVIEGLNHNSENETPIRRVRGCVEAWQEGMNPMWLVNLRREMKTVGMIEWVDSKVDGPRSAVVLWKARDL